MPGEHWRLSWTPVSERSYLRRRHRHVFLWVCSWLYWTEVSYFLLPTASEGWGKVMFSVCPHLWGGGGGGTPARSIQGVPQPRPGWGGYPPARSGWGGYPGTPPWQDSTWYAAIGMPLAFTQEDFLVCVFLVTKCNGRILKFFFEHSLELGTVTASFPFKCILKHGNPQNTTTYTSKNCVLIFSWTKMHMKSGYNF